MTVASSTSSSSFTRVLQHRELIQNLILRDFKARYKQSILGFAWAIVNPLVVSFIYWLVGSLILKIDPKIPFPVFAMYGVLFWNVFSTGLMTATESLIAHLSLITKVYFPREVFPISAVLSKLIDFGFGLIGLIPLLFVFHVVPGPGFFLTIPLLLILVVFTTGLGMLCACANLFYRDVRYLVQMILNLWLYLVPNMYTLEQVPGKYQGIYLLNPVAAVIEASRRLTFPQAGHDVPWKYVAVAAVTAIITFVVGFVVFKRQEPRFAEFV